MKSGQAFCLPLAAIHSLGSTCISPLAAEPPKSSAAATAKEQVPGWSDQALGRLGFIDTGSYQLETTLVGNSNSGREHGAGLAASDKADLIDFLKTLGRPI